MRRDHIFSLTEPEGLVRTNEFIQIGIGLPSGMFDDTRKIQLYTEANNILLSERIPTAYWPDDSIKWCLLKFTVTLNAYESKKVFLKLCDQIKVPEKNPLIFENPGSIKIQTKEYCFHFNKTHFSLFDKITKDNLPISENGFCNLIREDGASLVPVIRNLEHRTAYTEHSPLYSELKISGEFKSATTSTSIEALFEANYIFLYETNIVKFSFVIHNPRRAIHPSGLWDLGDVNSLFIKDLSLGFEITDKTDVQWKAERNKDWENLIGNELNIYQESSGGENWNSPNHRNRDNKLPLQIKGYLNQCENKTETGCRASPVISLGNNVERINVFISKFWQNFPKSLGISGNKAKIGLFPDQFPDIIELQPGEKSTHDFYLSIDEQADDFSWASRPIIVKLNPEWLNQCGVLPHLPPEFDDDPIIKIIQGGLTSTNNFFAKREVVDEYGWRNFGDIYADHETDLYEGSEIFISHYNNQYDPLYGFLYQYALTGDSRWFELADDLARHITDIDIYHVDSDKEEYNGGLFWHTDHYLEAVTATHRTYSKHHVENTYENHSFGGGPGEQHCYTAGLLYHYLLTGSESSKLAVFQLSNWMTAVYEGTGTIFGLITAIKNRNQGLKNILACQYSLDRGTGNYLNALLDRFVLEKDKSILQRVEFIIQHTVHPRDNIYARNLDKVELNWFYTVFLQSICRYLKTKEELEELDSAFYYARDSLLHYADWMVQNEYPYLEIPEILEYPNHTWTAQDIRKVHILNLAAYYSSEKGIVYMEKAHQLNQSVVATLSNEPTRTYTRILSILMQNYASPVSISSNLKKTQFEVPRTYETQNASSIYSVTRNFISELSYVIRHFSLKKEIRWLNRRISILIKLSNTR